MTENTTNMVAENIMPTEPQTIDKMKEFGKKQGLLVAGVVVGIGGVAALVTHLIKKHRAKKAAEQVEVENETEANPEE